VVEEVTSVKKIKVDGVNLTARRKRTEAKAKLTSAHV